MLGWIFYDNTVVEWLLAVAAAAFAIGALWLVRRLLSSRLRRLRERGEAGLSQVLAATLDATQGWFRLVVGVWAGSLVLVLPPGTRLRVVQVATLALIVQAGLWGATAIATWVEVFGAQKMQQGDGAAATTMRAVGFLARIAVWVVAALVVLDTVLGVNITALVAGLGIGGIAVALALQNVLSDLFASLSIVFDKPFVAGDQIQVGSEAGVVERVGLKTTRLRSVTGEQLVISNSDLLSSRIRNLQRMTQRRVTFTLGFTYQTPIEKLRRVPDLVREVVEPKQGVRFDHAHFQRYGPSSLDFEVVYFIPEPSPRPHIQIQQDINFELLERLAGEGLDLAYPTQTLHVAREPDKTW